MLVSESITCLVINLRHNSSSLILNEPVFDHKVPDGDINNMNISMEITTVIFPAYMVAELLQSRLVNKGMSHLNATINVSLDSNANAIFKDHVQMQMFWVRSQIQMQIFYITHLQKKTT